MKNMRTRNFEDTKRLIKTLVVLAVICCVGCLFFTQEGTVLQAVLVILTLVFMVAAITVVFLYSRGRPPGDLLPPLQEKPGHWPENEEKEQIKWQRRKKPKEKNTIIPMWWA